jgi:hypothetical protein
MRKFPLPGCGFQALECLAFQPGIARPESGQQEQGRPAAGGQQPAAFGRACVPGQPRCAEPAPGQRRVPPDLPLAPPVRAGRQDPIRRDRIWLFLTAIRGLLGIALDDQERARAAYRSLLPCAAQPVGAESMLVTLWPAAQVLGDLARYLGIPDADAHYRHALAIAEQANARPWREAAIRRLA